MLPAGHPSGRQSALDWPHLNTTAYPRAAAGVGLLETQIKPTEVLYVPPVWFHSTEAIGPGPNLGCVPDSQTLLPSPLSADMG